MKLIESLESRIAPAVLIGLGGHTATYTDVDGDHVTVAISAGTLTSGLFTTTAAGAGEQLQMLDLSGGGFDGANLTFTVAKVAGGDGLANVGFINSSGHDLGNVTVKGDLGRIDAGDAVTTTPGLKTLSARSMGRLGTDTQMTGGNLQTLITGPLGALAISGDVENVFFDVDGGGHGSIDAITIGGSLIGGLDPDSGWIYSDSDVGPVKIGRDIVGGDGQSSGVIDVVGKLASLTIGGSLVGGAGSHSGMIYGGVSIGLVKIGGDLQGGSGGDSGLIQSNVTLGGVTIGGSLIGGSGAHSGEIYSSKDMGPIKVRHDIHGGKGGDSGLIQCNANLAAVTVGGSLIGGAGSHSGELYAGKDMGAVRIVHDITGGSDTDTGLIQCNANLASVTVGGSVTGGSGMHSGEIYGGKSMGPVKIAHNLQGGAGSVSGYIQSGGKLTSVTIGGSLAGGPASFTGEIYSAGDMGAVKIGRNITGGSITGADSLDSSGVIESVGGIASVAVGGSIISGTDSSTGALFFNATIRAANDIGSLTVAGSLVGHGDTGMGASPVIISARGQSTPGVTTDLALGKVSVGGRVEFTNVLAGCDLGLVPMNGDAQIGAVKVGGDWVASNLIAGAKNLGADDMIGGTGNKTDNLNFGDAHDSSAGTGSATILSRIASITIKGRVIGSPDSFSATDSFGFVAEQIGAVKVGGLLAALTADAHNDNRAIGQTTDFHIHEV